MVLRGPPAAIDKLVTGEDRGIVGKKRNPSVLWAVLAAALYAINAPASKLLLQDVSPTMMAAMLYLGAGIGMSMLGMGRQRLGLGKAEQKLTRKDLPFTIGMIVLDIAAPICLMIGLTSTTPANASLLNNFEIAATSMIALFLFKEPVSKRLWLAIGLITLSSVILSFEDASSLHFSAGSLFVLLACICWGFENNCTRMMSQSDPLEVVVLKGFGSGLGSLAIALTIGERFPAPQFTLYALLLGFVAYGLSIFFYVYAQRKLGAAKTSTYYAIAPFIGVILSLLVFRQPPSPSFWAAFAIMLLGTYFAA